MTWCNLIIVVVAGFLVAVFDHNAQASTFTNGDFTTYVQADWGDSESFPAPTLLTANYNTVYASTAGVLEVGIPGTN